jgi:uncharacterized protein
MFLPSSPSQRCGVRLRLPNGASFSAVVMETAKDRAQGMQFRPPLQPDQVMLFVHPMSGRYPIHMQNVGFPINVVWLDSNLKICEMDRATPGPYVYGGAANSKYVIEAPAGFIRTNGLKIGGQISLGLC